MSAVIDYEPGVSVKFGPSATVAGINVGSVAGDPSSPVNGDLWYDSTANELTARINGANVALGAGGSTTLTSTYIGYGSGANAVTGEAAFAYDSTFNILSVDAIKLFATGVGISAASSGVLKLEGLGSGFDEAINMDFDTTSNVVRTSSPATGVTIMDYLDMSLRVTDGGGNFATLGPSGITVHNSAWAGNYTLDFGGTDGANEEIASKEWVNAQGFGGSLTATYVGYGDGANALTGEAAFAYTAASNTLGIETIQLGATGVNITNDSDGAITFTGSSAGADEDLTLNFDDTSNSIVASSSTGAGVDLSGLAVTAGTLADANGVPLHTTVAAVGAGTAYTMTATYATVDMGTTDPSIPITAAGTYMVWANVQTSFAGASYAAVNSMTFRLYEQTGAAALTDGERGDMIPVMTTITNLGPSIMIGPVEHVTADTDDVIVIQGDLGATPSAGTVTVTKATVYAVRVR